MNRYTCLACSATLSPTKSGVHLCGTYEGRDGDAVDAPVVRLRVRGVSVVIAAAGRVDPDVPDAGAASNG